MTRQRKPEANKKYYMHSKLHMQVTQLAVTQKFAFHEVMDYVANTSERGTSKKVLKAVK